MSQNVQFGISKFPGIWTLALSYIVPLNIFDISNGLATRPLQRKVPLMFQTRGSTLYPLEPLSLAKSCVHPVPMKLIFAEN